MPSSAATPDASSLTLPDAAVPLPRPGWLLSDSTRAITAALLGTGVSLLAIFGVIGFSQIGARVDQVSWAWGWVLAIWALLTLSHVGMTWFAFRGLEGERLEAAVMESARRSRGRSRWKMWLSTGGEAPAYAAQMAGFALLGVLALMANGRLREQPIMVIVAGTLVVVAWLECLVTYALHYAREDVMNRIIAFPEGREEPRSWSDYVYLSVSVQTTFGVTDLDLVGRHARRVVTQHALLAFGFNTVLIAMMVSLALTR